MSLSFLFDEMAAKPSISIIGPGKVGTAIGRLAAAAGYDVVAVAGRNTARARAAARTIGRGVAILSPEEAAASAGLVLLTVPDRIIEPLCRRLAEAGAFTPGCVVAHCSGALDSHILEPAKDICHCRIASFHPLMTFPTPQAAIEAMPGTYFFCEGDQAAMAMVEKLARGIGGIPVRLGAIAGKTKTSRGAGADLKALYHAAACVASNYLVSLMDAALAFAESSGIGRRTAWVALAPLIEATLNNITRLSPAGALTGPIARGDLQTVQRHLTAIAGRADLDALYRQMGLWTVGLARRKKSLAPADARKLLVILRRGRSGR